VNTIDTAIFAGGCFWGMQYYFENQKGVKSTEVGYIGGHIENPTYEDVCSHKSGHIEALQVVFDSTMVSFEALAKLFFEIHDPGQVNRQGPDIGEQYKSAVFYRTQEQKQISEKLISELKSLNYSVATELIKATTFWKAENYHQHYYSKKSGSPYCHFYQKKFK
jgi:peptide methionine sulfoxide reductase msrA/msrB